MRRTARATAAGTALAAVAASLGFALAAPTPASAVVAVTPAPTYVTDGRVDVVLPLGSRIYLAGAFTLVGPNTGLGVVVDGSSGAVSSSWGLAGGSVLAQASDGSGGWYLGGSFTVDNGARQVNAIHVQSDGTLDQTWNPRPNSTVRAIAYDAGKHTVYLGGDFTNLHGSADAYLAAVDDNSGAAVAGFSATPDASVLSLATDPGRNTLYLGGSFQNVDGSARSHLAAVSMGSGSLTSLATPAASGDVRAIVRSPDASTVYVGGIFGTLGTLPRARAGAFSTTTGAVSTTFVPNPTAAVDALLFSSDGSGLYVGGEFSTIAGSTSPLLARVSPATGARDSSFAPAFATTCTMPNPDTACTAGVRALALGAGGSTVLVGGWFTAVHGLTRDNVAQLSTAGTPSAWNPVANGPVDAVGVNGNSASSVVLGGELTSVGATSRHNLAALNRQTGALDPTWAPAANAQVRTMIASPDGSHLWLGGDFSTMNGVARARLAKLATDTGGLDPTFHPATSKSVSALGLFGSRLYVGGSFPSLAGLATKYLGLVDATSGAGYRSFLPAPNGVVDALAFTSSGATVWVGGSFTGIGGRSIAGLAGVSASTGKAVSWTPSPRPANVLTIATGGGLVCIGSKSNQLGCYNTSSGAAQLYVRQDGNVQAVAMANGTVYAGGHFNVARLATGDVTRRKLESFSLTTGALLPWSPVINSALGVFAISAQPDGISLGGDFTEISSVTQQGFARLPGSP